MIEHHLGHPAIGFLLSLRLRRGPSLINVGRALGLRLGRRDDRARILPDAACLS